MTKTLAEWAVEVLETAEPAEKVALTYKAAAAWREGGIKLVGEASPPDRPARPSVPELRHPREMPKRTKGGAKGKIALLHALAHIELNAIDLAWDIIARFTDRDMPRSFYDDWVQVADDEARHFELLEVRLNELESGYGQHPAHDGLWEAAQKTAKSLHARLAIVPMNLEARGLDVTPTTIEQLRSNGDERTAEILQIIYQDEITHVSFGTRWFQYLCTKKDCDPESTFHALLAKYFKGVLKPPFNHEARAEAGMPKAFYNEYAANEK